MSSEPHSLGHLLSRRTAGGAAASLRAVGRSAVRLVRGAEPAEIPAPLVGGPFEEVQTDVGPFWMLVSDEVMRPYMLVQGRWEQETAELLRKLIRPGCRFLDVGANVGYFSVLAATAAQGVTVDAVEPHPVICDLLRTNIWLNHVEARVWNVALGRDRRFITMSSPPLNPGDSRVGTTGSVGDLIVPIVSADELFPDVGFDVVKVDVQGWEPEVVLGMERVVRDSPGIVLVVEFFPTALRERGLEPEEVLHRYVASGYEISVHDEWGLGACELRDVVDHCDTAGVHGQVNLVLRRP